MKCESLFSLIICLTALISSQVSAQTKRPVSLVPEFVEIIDRFDATADARLVITVKANEVKSQILTGRNWMVLSVPVEIKNNSNQTVFTNLRHEWSGGIAPRSDLTAAAFVKGFYKNIWLTAPGYQVGVIGGDDKTILQPRQSKTIDVRLNWPGTGSEPSEPLIDETVSGKYPVRFLLLFQMEGKRKYAESDEVALTVDAVPPIVEASYALNDLGDRRTLWLSAVQMGQTFFSNGWPSFRGKSVVKNAESMRGECEKLLASAKEPYTLPEQAEKIITVRVMVNNDWLTKRFAIDNVPIEIQRILKILKIYDEDIKRFCFEANSPAGVLHLCAKSNHSARSIHL